MSIAGAERRVLDEAPGVRAMTGVIAIMLFLTVLAGALGLGTLRARVALAGQLAGRMTVQLVDGDAPRRAREGRTVTATLRASPLVARVATVDRGELVRLLQPWLGSDAADPDLPMPVLIDVDLAPGTRVDAVAALVRGRVPTARIDRQAGWMSPVTGFMATLAWLAGALVLLMAAVTALVVMLAVRAGLESHRPTIEVMHMLGATDRQIARLFQRRIALDALFGGIGGAAAALLVVAFVGLRLAALGSAVLSGATLGWPGWLALAALPFAFVVLATAAARAAVLATLRKTL